MRSSSSVPPQAYLCVRGVFRTYCSVLALCIGAGLLVSCGTTDVVFREFSAPDGGPAEWRLAPGHFIPARMPMHVVHPRPDAETGAVARHRVAHPGLMYEVPIGVQGGAWPFLYELVDAPAGAAIGGVYGSTNYGVITWSAPAAGTFTFRVRVSDQELNTVDVEWGVRVDASTFVFIDGDRGDDTNTGTLSAPLRTFAGMYKGDQNDATFAGRILVFRGATVPYALTGDIARNNNAAIDGAQKPLTWIAFPGERPIIDASQSKVRVEGLHDDLYFAGLAFEHGRQDVSDAHFIWVVGVGDRATFFRNTFVDLGPGMVGNEGTGAIWINDANAVKENILVKQNRYEDVQNGSAIGAYAALNSVRFGLIEEEEAMGSNSRNGWLLSRGFGSSTIRANRSRGSSGRQITVNLNRQDLQNQEVCWNDIRSEEGTVLLWSSATVAPGIRGSFLYRNTFVGPRAVLRFIADEPYRTDGNVVAIDDIGDYDVSITQSTSEPDLVGERGDGVVDAENRLTPAFAEFRGRRGHRVE